MLKILKILSNLIKIKKKEIDRAFPSLFIIKKDDTYYLNLLDTIRLIKYYGYNKTTRFLWITTVKLTDNEEELRPSSKTLCNYYEIVPSTETIDYEILKRNIDNNIESPDYPCLSIHDVLNWILDEYNIYLHIFIVKNGWEYTIEDVKTHECIYESKDFFKSYTGSLINGLNMILTIL